MRNWFCGRVLHITRDMVIRRDQSHNDACNERVLRSQCVVNLEHTQPSKIRPLLSRLADHQTMLATICTGADACSQCSFQWRRVDSDLTGIVKKTPAFSVISSPKNRLAISNQSVSSHNPLELVLDCLEAHGAARLALEMVAHSGQCCELLPTANTIRAVV